MVHSTLKTDAPTRDPNNIGTWPLHEQAKRLWEVEGGNCISFLVSTIAGGYGSIENTERLHSRGREEQAELAGLTEAAFELACPIDDWEGAAREDNPKVGCHKDTERDEWCCWSIPGDDGDSSTWSDSEAGAWQQWCEVRGIEPHQTEVYEHWIVSDWLADRLAEHGEKVDKDFAGLTVWARTTTGQAVYADHVIERIAKTTYGREGSK